MRSLSMLSLVLGLSAGIQAPLVFAETPKKAVSKADQTKAKKAVTAADKAFKAADYQKALASYQEAQALNPSPDNLAAIGDCYAMLTKYPEALEAYNNFLKEAGFGHPRRAEIEKKVPETKTAIANANRKDATIAYGAKDYTKALTLFQASFEISQDPTLYYNMAMCQMQLKNTKDGIVAIETYLKSAPATDPNRADAEAQLIVMYETSADSAFAAGQYEEALGTYRMLYSKDAQPKRLANMGMCYEKMGKTEDANTSYRNFLKQADPSDPKRAEIEAKLPKEKTVVKNPDNGKGGKKDKKPDAGGTKERSGLSKGLLALSGASAVGAGVTGFLAFSANKDLVERSSVASASEIDEQAIADSQLRKQMFAPIADVLLGVAAGAAILGLVVPKKTVEAAKTTLLVSPSGATLSVKF